MTLNGLTIDDRIVTKFKLACANHYQNGGPRVCQKARMRFFADLRQQHDDDMDRIKPHLRELFLQLVEWESEARTNGKQAA